VVPAGSPACPPRLWWSGCVGVVVGLLRER
jgi:hypothetical protein